MSYKEPQKIFKEIGETKTIPPLFELEPAINMSSANTEWDILFFDNGKLLFYTDDGYNQDIRVMTVGEFERRYLFGNHPVFFKKVEK